MDLNHTEKGLTSAQKAGFVLLLIFGLTAVGLGFLQMRNTIYNPFALRLTYNNNVEKLFNNEEARLQSIDTDHDGLNDWEELNFYQTSPYLPDTDSDGITDKTEIDQGSDPLCPKGKTCENTRDIEIKNIEPILSPVSPQVVTPEDILQKAGLIGPAGDEISNVLSTLSDPKKVREMLLKSGGISEADLSKIDDVTLMQMVNELLSSQMETSSTPTTE